MNSYNLQQITSSASKINYDDLEAIVNTLVAIKSTILILLIVSFFAQLIANLIIIFSISKNLREIREIKEIEYELKYQKEYEEFRKQKQKKFYTVENVSEKDEEENSKIEYSPELTKICIAIVLVISLIITIAVIINEL